MKKQTESGRRVMAFFLADFFLGHMPRKVSYVVMTVVGWIVATVFPKRIHGLRDNLRRVFPEYSNAQITDLMQRNAKNYGKFWVDLFRMPRLDPDYRSSLARIDGIEGLHEILARGKGCIVISIHMGGWEGCISVWGGMQDIRSGLITEVLEPPRLWRHVLELRQATGLEIIPLNRTAPRDILRRLKENGIVAGAIDRDILGTGKPYRFFDGTVKIPAGLFEVAQRTGAGMLPVLCLREPNDTYRIVGMKPFWVGPEAGATDAAVRSSLRVFEDSIRRYPDQWHVMEPLWKRGSEAEAEAVEEAADADPGAAVRIYPAGGGNDMPNEEASVG